MEFRDDTRRRLKRNRKKIIAVALVVAVGVLWFGESTRAAIDLPWETTYNCSDWNNYTDPLSCDGLSKGGGWTDSEGHFEQITAAANYPGGGGGKGQRHWIGPGTNSNSGGIGLYFNTPQTNFWMRCYIRWEAGFNNNWNQYKMLYIYPSTGNVAVWQPGYGNNGIRLYHNSANYGCDNCGFGGAFYQSGISDGSWQCMEIHFDIPNSVFQAWVNGNLVINSSTVSYGMPDVSSILIGSNCKDVTNPQCMYVDYDDIAISNTGYIGPINATDTNPPAHSNPHPTGTLPAGTTSTNISLETNVQAICRYSNTSNTNYTDMEHNFTYTNSTNHSTLVTHLENGKTYTYYVRCNSTEGYVNTDDFNITFSVDGHKADLNDDGIIDMPELMVFIGRWTTGDGVTKQEVEEARGIWFTGGVC
ncbi:MAG: hypothetical protein U9M95_04325 [Candidatus Altiarchaeota archaeon]|nr:hypothetical protein [Candidatus Altiarchaeota archaeon]